MTTTNKTAEMNPMGSSLKWGETSPLATTVSSTGNTYTALNTAYQLKCYHLALLVGCVIGGILILLGCTALITSHTHNLLATPYQNFGESLGNYGSAAIIGGGVLLFGAGCYGFGFFKMREALVAHSMALEAKKIAAI